MCFAKTSEFRKLRVLARKSLTYIDYIGETLAKLVTSRPLFRKTETSETSETSETGETGETGGTN